MEDPQNQNPQNDFNQTPQQNPKKQIPSWIGFVIIIAAIAILFGGVFAYQYYFVKPQPVVQTPPIKTDQTAELVLSETEGWKTYKNELYGIEFQYPGELGNPVVNALSIRTLFTFPTNYPGLSIEFQKGIFYNQISGRNMTVDELSTSMAKNYKSVLSVENAIVGGKTALKVQYLTYTSTKEEDYYIPIDASGDILIASASTNSDDENFDIFDRIISTFKFTTPTDQFGNKLPVINSIMPNSGSIGTTVEIRGENLAGFESDLHTIIENSKGEKGVILAENQSEYVSDLIRIKIRDKFCQQDTSYSGLPCKSYLIIAPGIYKIYTQPWGNKSNVVNFEITK